MIFRIVMPTGDASAFDGVTHLFPFELQCTVTSAWWLVLAVVEGRFDRRWLKLALKARISASELEITTLRWQWWKPVRRAGKIL
jgi:hypothetical protein